MLILFLLSTCGSMLVEATLSTVPSDTTAEVGSTVELHCTSVNGPPTDRVMWVEFASYSGGQVVSDGKDIMPSTVNRDRYSIVGDELDYHLQIRDVQLSDAGTYMCQDINSGPPDVSRGYAELTVLEPESTTTPPTTTPTTPAPAVGPCTNSTGYWVGNNPDAALCLEVDSNGRVVALWRNDSSYFYVTGYGSADMLFEDYKHITFSVTWPYLDQGWVTGYIGECHVCNGEEVILLSGVSRSRAWAPGCGQTGGTLSTKLYTLARKLPSCRGLEVDVYNPKPWVEEKIGVKARPFQP